MPKTINTKRTIWVKENDAQTVCIIDQRFLPHQLVVAELRTVADAAKAIKEMWIRGAPLIGATAAYGMYFAAIEAQNATDPLAYLEGASNQLRDTRPTAVNLHWALERQLKMLGQMKAPQERIQCAFETANEIVEEDVAICKKIGEYGLGLIKEISQRKNGKPVNILTHCNAGRMACIEWGTATSPIYHAHQAGIPVHVYVDETRPRNQGARITAWELTQSGIPHTVIVDNVGGHLMQHGMVDICFIGTDRTTRNGDVANKIGTYLKALAAKANNVPFYIGLPSSTIDWELQRGEDIPIEERGKEEVTHINGWSEKYGELLQVRLTPAQSPAINYGFDVTPAHLVTGLITEKGICEASEEGLLELFPERR